MANQARYNLRHRMEMPVELHLSADEFDDLLQPGQQSGQVSGSDTSFENDCDELIRESDNDADISDVQPLGASQNSDTQNDVSQQVINAQILAQLQCIGERLEKIERGNVKKTNDPTKIKGRSHKKKQVDTKTHTRVNSAQSHTTVKKPVSEKPDVVHRHIPSKTKLVPGIHALRSDLEVQQEVEKRLQELAALNSGSNSKTKSLRGGIC